MTQDLDRIVRLVDERDTHPHDSCRSTAQALLEYIDGFGCFHKDTDEFLYQALDCRLNPKNRTEFLFSGVLS